MRIQSSLKNHRIARRLAAPLTIFVLVAAISFSSQPRSVVKADQDTAQAMQVQFTNPAPIACADRVSNNAGTNPGLPPGGVYPSTINVAGLSGTVTKVTVTFAMTSTFPDDFDILLVGPTTARSLVISDAGGSGDPTNVTYTFDQTSATVFPDNPTTIVPAGTYKPSNYVGLATPEPGGVDNFPAPGPGLLAYPTDFNIFNGTNPNGIWSLYVVDDQQIDTMSLPSGWSIDITTSGPPLVPTSRTCDFDGDNKTDLAVTRGSAGDLTWILRNSAGPTSVFQHWGNVGVTPVPQDYDGDGKTDIAIWRQGPPATWFILQSSNGAMKVINWGQPGDDPSVVDDYNGDGLADAAVVRDEGGFKVWYILFSFNIITTQPEGGGPSFIVRQWGLSADFVSPGDYDGDGLADFGVQRAEGVAPNKATFYFLYSGGGTFARPWGQNTDAVVPGDYDGDGKTDIAVVHGEGGNFFWWIVLSNGGYVLGDQFGLAGDFSVQGDYDGDNTTDEAVWRPSTGTFHIKQSGGGVLNAAWGLSTDYPPAYYNTH
jgi:hypothetical protein